MNQPHAAVLVASAGSGIRLAPAPESQGRSVGDSNPAMSIAIPSAWAESLPVAAQFRLRHSNPGPVRTAATMVPLHAGNQRHGQILPEPVARSGTRSNKLRIGRLPRQIVIPGFVGIGTARGGAGVEIRQSSSSLTDGRQLRPLRSRAALNLEKQGPAPSEPARLPCPGPEAPPTPFDLSGGRRRGRLCGPQRRQRYFRLCHAASRDQDDEEGSKKSEQNGPAESNKSNSAHVLDANGSAGLCDTSGEPQIEVHEARELDPGPSDPPQIIPASPRLPSRTKTSHALRRCSRSGKGPTFM